MIVAHTSANIARDHAVILPYPQSDRILGKDTCLG
jgi:hypothetical protein